MRTSSNHSLGGLIGNTLISVKLKDHFGLDNAISWCGFEHTEHKSKNGDFDPQPPALNVHVMGQLQSCESSLDIFLTLG